MNEILKENDILLATVQKPDISNIDLFRNDITLDNTQLLSKDQYKSSPVILKKFSKDNVFDDNLFNWAYDLAASKYVQMLEDLLMSNFIDSLEYSKTSFFREPKHKISSTEYTGITLKNPLQLKVGLEGLNVKSEATKTEKEVAQSHNIWDPINKKWLEDSAESMNIFQKAFGAPLIYAKYTKDGELENPVTGEVGYHSAGEYITDENGDYFTQLAGNVDLTSNVETVKLQDILSDEDSWWNKLDFYDSDSKEKSIPGVVMKTLATTIPYFIPYLGPVYTTASVLVGLGENLPQIAKSFDWSPEGSAFSLSCNSVTNWFNRFSPSKSLHGQESFWSIENLGNLTADIVGQLYQLRGLASLSQYIQNTEKYAKELDAAKNTVGYAEALLKYTKAVEEQAKIAKALSLGYMSLVQAGDVYNDALDAGYSRGTAGLATLMSTAAFFGIMNYNESLNGLGTWFLDKTTGYDREILRAPVAKLAKKSVTDAMHSEEMGKILKDGGKNLGSKLHNYWLNFWNKIDDSVRIGAEGAWTSAIAEGVEEVSEEAVQDGVKGLIDGLNYLGYTSGKWGNAEASFGGWSNVFSKEGLERYFETLVGGALGGAMFHVTQNKIKPLTDSLFGIESEVPKEITYDEIDIALLGKEKEYYDEVDKAVRYIDDRLLDLGNPEDAKIYRAREAIASNLKNRMKTAVDLVKDITAGANFSTIPLNFREAVKKAWKPLVQSSGAIDYINKKFNYTVGNLANLRQEIQSRENDLSSNKDVDKEKTREIIKQKQEQAKVLKDLVLGFFTGQSYIDTHDEASWLANRDLIKGIAGSLTPQEYYENIVRKEGGLRYSELPDHSENPNKVTKETIIKETELFNKLFELQFDSDQLQDLYLRLPVINKAFKALTSLIGPDINLYLNDERRRTVVENTIRKMQQDRDILMLQLLAADLLDFLNEEEIQLYKDADDLKRQALRDSAYNRQLEIINQAFSIQNLMDLLKKDPNAFSLSDRRNIDYLDILSKKGVIKLADGLTDDLIKVLKSLINSEFANVPLSTLSKENVSLILDNIQEKLASEDGYWGSLFNETAQEDETSGIQANVNLNAFDIHLDKYDDSIEFVKLKDIEDFLASEEGTIDSKYISKEIYDFLFEQYKRLDAEFLSLFRGINFELNRFIDDYLLNPSRVTQNDLINEFADALQGDTILTIALKLNISENEPVENILNVIKLNLRAVNFAELNKGKERVENNFLKAIDKISFNIIGDANVKREISKQIASWEKSFRENKGLSIDSTLSKETLEHLQNVLRVLAIVVSTMTPVDTEYGQQESIQLRNKNFAEAMGLDSSSYHILGDNEGNLMMTMIQEMLHKVSLLKSIQGKFEIEQSEKFEGVRKVMLDNQFKLFRYHLADKDDPLYIQEIAEEIELDKGNSFTDEEKLQKVLEYQLAIYNRLLEEDFGGDIFKEYLERESSREKALVSFLMDTYGKKNGEYDDEVFYLDENALDANNQQDSYLTRASYLLNELVGLVGLGKDYSPKQIQEALEKSFEELGLYPRLDLIYTLLLIAYGIIAKNAYQHYGQVLESWYNDDASRGATKQYINNLIRVMGPAGSGKTSLFRVLVKAIESLETDTNKIPVAITAQSEYKVDNIKNDLKDSNLKEVNYSTIYDLISNLKAKQANWKILESKIITYLYNFFDDWKNGSLSSTNIDKKKKDKDEIDPGNPKYGKIEIKSPEGEDYITITVSGGTDEFADFEVEMTLLKSQIDQANFAGNLRFNFIGKSFNGIDINSTALNNGLLIIDECTNLSPFEWLTLNKLSKDKNFSILATGDPYQRGYLYKYTVFDSERTSYIGDENTLGLNTPSLISVHRALSTATENNERKIRDIADIAIEKLQNAENKSSHAGLNDYSFNTKAREEIIKLLGALQLEYTLNNESYGFLGGHITHTPEDLEKVLLSIQNKLNKSILVITDSKEADTTGVMNTLTSLGFKSENIKVVAKEDILGAEADYAIAYDISSTNSALTNLKEIYTLVTRGKLGFVSYGNNDLFTKNGVSSTAEKPVTAISSKNVTSEQKAKEWLDKWKNALENTDDSRHDTITEEKIPEPAPEIPEPEPEHVDEEKEKLKVSDKISQAFGESDWVISRQFGYNLGISLNTINAIKDKPISDWRDQVNGTAFGAFIKLLEGSETYREDKSAIETILSKIEKPSNSDVGSVYIDAFIKFVNIGREAYSNGQIQGVSFKKLSAYSGDKMNNPNIAYLKINDDPKYTESGSLTFGIPIFKNGQIDGHITLGILDSNTIKDASKLKEVGVDTPIFRVRTKNQDKLTAHENKLKEYHRLAKFTRAPKVYKSAFSAITNLRDWRIQSDWLGNIKESLINLGRISIEDVQKLGFELVPDSRFTGGNGTDVFLKFIEWYNRFRWADLDRDAANKFGSVIGHDGTYIAIRPIGTGGIGFPVLVKKVTDWETFISGAITKRSNKINKYAAVTILQAAAKCGLAKDNKFNNYTWSQIQALLIDDSKSAERTEFFNNLKALDSSVFRDDVLYKLRNSVLIGSNPNKVTDDVRDNRFSKDAFPKDLMTWLTSNAANFPYMNISGDNIKTDYIVQIVLEPENILIDMDLLEDPSEAIENKILGDVTITESSSNWGPGLTKSELEYIKNLINTFNKALSGKEVYSNNALKLSVIYPLLEKISQKASKEDILNLDPDSNGKIGLTIHLMIEYKLSQKFNNMATDILNKINYDDTLKNQCF